MAETGSFDVVKVTRLPGSVVVNTFAIGFEGRSTYENIVFGDGPAAPTRHDTLSDALANHSRTVRQIMDR